MAIYDNYSHIESQDPDLAAILRGEEQRQHEGLELIPSENYVSAAVREALASGMTNKYAEGYPGKRYYGGQEFTDQIENLAIGRACSLFGASYANVQPLSGAPANMAVYAALLQPGDAVMGLSLPHGGHLTHGHPATVPAKIYDFHSYEMSDITTGAFDFDAIRQQALEIRPRLIMVGFSAYTREMDWQGFSRVAREVGAVAVADVSHIAGLIAAGVAANPFDHDFDIITTTTHKTLRGPRGGMILIRESEDYFKKINKAVFPGLQGGPHMHQIAGKAVALGEALGPSFKTYARQVVSNARAMAEVLRDAGIVMVCGGTDNHMILVDVWSSFQIGGKRAQEVLDEAGITLNMNMIPGDTRSSRDPSGIRFGTPAITTRGLGEAQSQKVAQYMIGILKDPENETLRKETRNSIQKLGELFPVPEVF